MPFDATTKQLVPAPILEAVREVAHDWMMFGTFLGVPYRKLQEIGGPTNVGTCMLATLNEWITLRPQEATIHNLITAIRGPIIGNELLAQCIEGDSTIKEMFKFDKGISTILIALHTSFSIYCITVKNTLTTNCTTPETFPTCIWRTPYV